MQEISVLTIGLALLSFVLGALIVGLAFQSRARRLQEAHDEQVRRLRDEERRYIAAFEGSEASKSEVESHLDETQRSLEASARETEILRAQFQEEQEAAYGLEDRLNAAEARLLSTDVELVENRLEMQRWDAAYNRLKESHLRLAEAHHLAKTREEELSHVLSSGSGELEALQSRLDLLQTSLALALRAADAESASSDPTALIPSQLRELALAKVEAQSEVRRREDELTLLRSQLVATRFSLNVLAKSGAELASRFNLGDEETTEIAPAARFASTTNRAAQAEQLANLEGMIADWFEEMRGDMPYTARLLLSFSGASSADRFAAPESLTLPIERGQGEIARPPELLALDKWLAETEAGNLAGASKVSHDVMLAAIKAASVAALRRSKTREEELLAQLSKAQTELDEMQESITLQNALVIEDMRGMIPQASETSPADAEAAAANEGAAVESTADSHEDESPNGAAVLGIDDATADVLATDELVVDDVLVVATVTEDAAATDDATGNEPAFESATDVAVEEIPVLQEMESDVADELTDSTEETQTVPAADLASAEVTETIDGDSATLENAQGLAKALVLADIGNDPAESASSESVEAVTITDAPPTLPVVVAGIPRADIPMPATPKPSLPMPKAPGPAAAQTSGTPPLRTAWGRFVRRVETALQRPSGRK